MTTFRSKALILALGFATAGCDFVDALREGSRYCVAPKPYAVLPTSPTKGSIEQMILAEDCVHRLSYKLARAPGSNREIADAAVAGCRNVILGEANMRFKASFERDPTRKEEEEVMASLRPNYADQALFKVTSARAGRCVIP